MKNTLLVDFEPYENWHFGEVLQSTLQEEVDIRFCVSNGGRHTAFDNLWRLAQYFLFPLTLVFKRHKLGRVIGYQQFYALNYVFFCRLFGLPKVNEIVVLEFIYKRKSGFLGRLYHRYMRYIVTGKYIDLFVCFSKEECSYYSELFGIPAEKFRFVTLGMERLNLPLPDVDLQAQKYIFSTGRSNRDYDFLVNALSDTDYKLRIACDTYKRENTPNCVVDNRCFSEEMLRYMYNSHCVVIPLKDISISAGQLVILQAMQMKKPVIVTESKGITDYIQDGYSGLVIANNKQELLSALEKLYADDVLYKKLVDNALNEYEKRFSMESMAREVGVIITEELR